MKKKDKEKQYAISAEAVFVVCATSLREAKALLENQLQGLNTISVEIRDGQALVPQVEIDSADLD